MVRILQSQFLKGQEPLGTRRSHDAALVVHRSRLGNEQCPAGCKELGDTSSFHDVFVGIKEKSRTNTASTSVNTVGEDQRRPAQIPFFGQMSRMSNSSLSTVHWMFSGAL